MDRLSMLLAGVPKLLEMVDDKLEWKITSKGLTVKSVYDWFLRRLGSNRSHVALMRFIWKSLAPPSVQFFVWLVANGRIKSGESLFRYGIISKAETVCGLCGTSMETINHVLLHCMFVWRIWSA